MGTKRAVVAKYQDLPEGEMQQVLAEKTPVLLAKFEGKITAVSANCTHYGAPLGKGALKDKCVVCPWHNSRYNITTGKQTNPPGLDYLTQYQVEIDGEDVVVHIPEDTPRHHPPEMAEYDEKDSRIFVILGTGAAGTHAAETLRVAGFQGRILLVSAEDQLPYDRVVMSKKYLQEKSLPEHSLPLRSKDFYESHNIELMLGKTATKVTAKAQEITFTDNSTLKYDALLLATGGKVIDLPLPGADLENIFTLRTQADSDAILETIKEEQKAVVIGASFIGMETAASLTQQGLDVTVVAPEAIPFASIFGEEIGKLYLNTHQDNGVKFHLETKAKEFQGNGKVEKVILENGEQLEADLIIVGVGVKPATDYLEDIELNDQDQSVITNEYMQVDDHLYAAGDIATFPYWQTGKETRIEHWVVAAQQGRVAAHNMAGETVPYRGIPFFWTTQFDLKLRYGGHADEWDEIIFDGDISGKEFLALYLKNNQVLAVASNNRDQDMAAVTELMRTRKMPPVETLRQSEINWLEALKG
jgi:NADPH-dependent 2,4-dienoyl-CoA reductase/sulfur reductase-like enzyme/nitrite reductase/ring-hydroxylating ferredoxin subunit